MTDLDLVKKALAPFKKGIPFFLQGAFDASFTHEKIKAVYDAVGGEAGVKELADAIVRIGKSEVIGEP